MKAKVMTTEIKKENTQTPLACQTEGTACGSEIENNVSDDSQVSELGITDGNRNSQRRNKDVRIQEEENKNRSSEHIR